MKKLHQHIVLGLVISVLKYYIDISVIYQVIAFII